MSPVVAEMGRSLRGYWRDARSPQRVVYLVGAALVVVGLAHGLAWLVVGGPVDGPLSWRKPVAFGISFGLTTATLAWVSQFLALSDRGLRATLFPLAAANTIEVAWVSVQRARGVPSHFNFETGLDGALFIVNGIAILVTIGVIVGFTVRAFTASTASPSMTLALRVGLLILLVSMAAGVWMILRGTAFELPPVRVGESGNIKFAHAIGMHGIQTLCALAWLASFAVMGEDRRVRLVGLAALGYTIATTATMVLAALGLAAWTSGLAGAVVGLLALGCLAAAGSAVVGSLARRSARRS